MHIFESFPLLFIKWKYFGIVHAVFTNCSRTNGFLHLQWKKSLDFSQTIESYKPLTVLVPLSSFSRLMLHACDLNLTTRSHAAHTFIILVFVHQTSWQKKGPNDRCGSFVFKKNLYLWSRINPTSSDKDRIQCMRCVDERETDIFGKITKSTSAKCTQFFFITSRNDVTETKNWHTAKMG